MDFGLCRPFLQQHITKHHAGVISAQEPQSRWFLFYAQCFRNQTTAHLLEKQRIIIKYNKNNLSKQRSTLYFLKLNTRLVQHQKRCEDIRDSDYSLFCFLTSPGDTACCHQSSICSTVKQAYVRVVLSCCIWWTLRCPWPAFCRQRHGELGWWDGSWCVESQHAVSRVRYMLANVKK